jgi:hypothetical protein
MTSESVALPAKMAWYIELGVIRQVWYPVFPPDKNAEVALCWRKTGKSTWLWRTARRK